MSVFDLPADLASHHIEGIAIHGNVPFRVPLVSQIDGNLWTGGCIDGARLPEWFRYVVSLYPWEKYTLGPGTDRFEFPLLDAAEMPPAEALHEAAGLVNLCIAEGPTLVHCQAGLNRSALVAGLALMQQGMTPADAIALLRERRCSAVLCNRTFEAWLLEDTRGDGHV